MVRCGGAGAGRGGTLHELRGISTWLGEGCEGRQVRENHLHGHEPRGHRFGRLARGRGGGRHCVVEGGVV